MGSGPGVRSGLRLVEGVRSGVRPGEFQGRPESGGPGCGRDAGPPSALSPALTGGEGAQGRAAGPEAQRAAEEGQHGA